MPDQLNKNVFINCPFDREYYELLRSILFTILYLGFFPRIASERFDSGEPRFKKIIELINLSRYSIHDLSRLISKEEGEYYRLNMAFEIGLDIGCREFSDVGRNKKSLIIENEPYRYSRAISDLAGFDIKYHNGDQAKLIRVIRDWFIENGALKKITNATDIWYEFNEFSADFYEKRKSEGFTDDDLNTMPVPEYIEFIKEWMIHHNK